MIPIEHTLPEDPLQAEVCVHVRRHLFHAVEARDREMSEALAILFGISMDEAEELEFGKSGAAADAFVDAAERLAAKRRPKLKVVRLAHDDEFIKACHQWLLKRIFSEEAFGGVIADDLRTLLVMSNAIDLATADAATSSGTRRLIPILIEGETGTGKELLARAIHKIAKQRAGISGDFHAIQVSGLPHDLIAGELFGVGKGAFTGAHKDRQGRLEDAAAGTLLIDEVGDLPAHVQIALLRVLQECTYSRLGENETHPVSARIVAATLHNLESLASPVSNEPGKPTFRVDLLQRLRVGYLRLPALRDRGRWSKHVVPAMLKQLGNTAKLQASQSVLDALQSFPWVGNLRQLHGVLAIASHAAKHKTVHIEHLPAEVLRNFTAQPIEVRAAGILLDVRNGGELTSPLIDARLDQIERALDMLDLDQAEGRAPLLRVRESLLSIPDNSIAHRLALGRLDEFLKNHRIAFRKSVSVWLYDYLVKLELPDAVSTRIKAERAVVTKELERLSTLLSAEERGLELDRSPFFKLLKSVSSLPILTDADKVGFAKLFSSGLGLLKHLAPDLLGRLSHAASKGNWSSIGEVVRDYLSKFDGNGQELLIPPGNPRTWSKRQWLEVVPHFRSCAEAAREIDASEKSIRKYLTKAKVKAPW